MWRPFPLLRLVPFLFSTMNTPRGLVEQFRGMYLALEELPPNLNDTEKLVSPMMRFHRHSYEDQKYNSNNNNNNGTTTTTTSKPVALYIPGLDGYGISATQQFNDLSDAFDLWRVVVDRLDRSSFLEMVTAISGFVAKYDNVTLIGESCGGLLATAVALQLQDQPDKLQGLVLVNPATSYEQTIWDRAVPFLTTIFPDRDESLVVDSALSPYAITASLLLALIIPDWQQSQRIVDTVTSLSMTSTSEIIDAMRDNFQSTEELLPSAMLKHRVVQWLTVGTQVVTEARIRQLAKAKLPVLIIAGAQDQLLPSRQEAKRLQRLLPQAESLVLPDRGHFVLDDTVNLTEAILYSKIDPFNTLKEHNAYDPVTDWKFPEQDVRDYIKSSIQGWRDTFSPVYFSTDENGKRWKGLGQLPSSSSKSNPLLFVGNHQFAALDMQLMLADLWQDRGIFLRGLAHPVTFIASENLNFRDLGGRRPGVVSPSPRNMSSANPASGLYQKFGALLVSPRNYYRLMQTKQDTLLFPGGAREAFSGDTRYPLFWPKNKVDFVRTAARFNATIVPFSAVGMVDSVNVLAEPEELLNLPIIGDILRQQSANISAARYDQGPDEETMAIPLVVPTLPSRNYFLFGKPIDTTQVDPWDKKNCERVYLEAQQQVRQGIDDLLIARKRDPFRDTPSRVLYERLWGKSAPTFPVKELNTKRQ